MENSKCEKRYLISHVSFIMPKTLSNYLKNKAKGTLEILQITSKTRQKESPKFFKTKPKTRQGIPKILSNYFKNKTKRILEILQTILKTRHKESPRFF